MEECALIRSDMESEECELEHRLHDNGANELSNIREDPCRSTSDGSVGQNLVNDDRRVTIQMEDCTLIRSDMESEECKLEHRLHDNGANELSNMGEDACRSTTDVSVGENLVNDEGRDTIQMEERTLMRSHMESEECGLEHRLHDNGANELSNIQEDPCRSTSDGSVGQNLVNDDRRDAIQMETYTLVRSDVESEECELEHRLHDNGANESSNMEEDLCRSTTDVSVGENLVNDEGRDTIQMEECTLMRSDMESEKCGLEHRLHDNGANELSNIREDPCRSTSDGSVGQNLVNDERRDTIQMEECALIRSDMESEECKLEHRLQDNGANELSTMEEDACRSTTDVSVGENWVNDERRDTIRMETCTLVRSDVESEECELEHSLQDNGANAWSNTEQYPCRYSTTEGSVRRNSAVDETRDIIEMGEWTFQASEEQSVECQPQFARHENSGVVLSRESDLCNVASDVADGSIEQILLSDERRDTIELRESNLQSTEHSASDDEGNLFEYETDADYGATQCGERKREKRKYNKLLACFFCQKLLKMKMKRHLVSVHRDDPLIKEILEMSDEKAKAREFARLVKRGNFLHNTSVLSGGAGELIVGRQVKQKHDPSKYVPCVYCQTMLLQHDLGRHVSKCSLRPVTPALDVRGSTSSSGRMHAVSESRMFLYGAINSDDVPCSKKFTREILGSLQHDEISRIVKKDDLIIRLGSSLHERYGKYRVHICQHMRQLARLLREVNSMQLQKNAARLSLSQCISGSNFDTVVEATRNLCMPFDDINGRPQFHSPSIGMKLGHHLVRCADIKRGMSIRENCETTRRDVESFIALHKSEWTSRISSASLATLKSPRYNSPDELPLTADLIKLKQYQDHQLTVLTKQLTAEKSSYSLWKTLMETTYSRLVIFNKRRCGETAKLTVEAFRNRPRWEDCASDQLANSLKPLEQRQLSRLLTFCEEF